MAAAGNVLLRAAHCCISVFQLTQGSPLQLPEAEHLLLLSGVKNCLLVKPVLLQLLLLREGIGGTVGKDHPQGGGCGGDRDGADSGGHRLVGGLNPGVGAPTAPSSTWQC